MSDTLFHRIARVLSAAGLNYSEAARRCGVPAKTLTNWVTGIRMPSPQNLSKFAACFGVSLDWLYEGDRQPPAPEEACPAVIPVRGRVKQHWRTPGLRTGSLHIQVPDLGRIRVTIHRVLDGRALVTVEVPDGVTVQPADESIEPHTI